MDQQQFVQQRFAKMEEEISAQKDILSKAAEAILDQEVSLYPIFVVHQHQVDIGIPILEKGVNEAEWSVNASTLEELATKKIIEMSKVDDFKQVYKDASRFLCLFVLSDMGANFIFLPR